MRITLGHPLHHRFLLLQSYLLFLTRYVSTSDHNNSMTGTAIAIISTIRGLIFVLPRISTDIESLEYTAFSWSLLAVTYNFADFPIDYDLSLNSKARKVFKNLLQEKHYGYTFSTCTFYLSKKDCTFI